MFLINLGLGDVAVVRAHMEGLGGELNWDAGWGIPKESINDYVIF